MADPHGKAAAAFVATMAPFIKLIGAKLPYSPASQAIHLSEIYALVYRFGVPTVYVTISPDDIHSALGHPPSSTFGGPLSREVL